MKSTPGPVSKRIGRPLAESSRESYDSAYRQWSKWAVSRGYVEAPANPVELIEYLEYRAAQGCAPITLKHDARGVEYRHLTQGLESPVTMQVRLAIDRLCRRNRRPPRQVRPIGEREYAAIRATTHIPRPKWGTNVFESEREARVRGDFEIALIGTMLDGLLRGGEVGSLIWRDLVTEEDGSGRLLLRRSKTDQLGESITLYISPRTMRYLNAIRNGADNSATIFDLNRNLVYKRIVRACKFAGLGSGYGAHSPRIGMAQDLARNGGTLPQIMVAGRWKSPVMPAYYIRHEEAERGATARFYGHVA